jgi:hypothetical protein
MEIWISSFSGAGDFLIYHLFSLFLFPERACFLAGISLPCSDFCPIDFKFAL